jgi:uncharacterized protein (DUF305 family)
VRPRLGLLALAVVTALLVAACGGPDHNDADVSFATDMVRHHAQAVAMADLTIGRTGLDADVADLAEQIRKDQTPEINTMSDWLEEWGEQVPRTGYGSRDGHTHSQKGMGMQDLGDMPGMMTSEEMHGLDATKGAAFQRRWLEMMVEHHQGAIRMARTEVAEGEDQDTRALARRIIEGQQAEVDTMRTLLAR